MRVFIHVFLRPRRAKKPVKVTLMNRIYGKPYGYSFLPSARSKLKPTKKRERAYKRMYVVCIHCMYMPTHLAWYALLLDIVKMHDFHFFLSSVVLRCPFFFSFVIGVRAYSINLLEMRTTCHKCVVNVRRIGHYMNMKRAHRNDWLILHSYFI